MVNKQLISCAILASLTAVLAVGWNWPGNAVQSFPKRIPSASRAPGALAEVTAARPLTPEEGGEKSLRERSLPEYAAVKDWRPLVTASSAQRRPVSPSDAQAMVAFCAFAAVSKPWTAVGNASPQQPGQGDAQRGVETRCGSFTDAELSGQRFASHASDELIQARQKFAQARSDYLRDPGLRAPLVEAMDRFLAYQDPSAIDQVGLSMITYKDRTTGRIQFFFDGRTYALGSSPDVGLALFLAPCSMGLKCDASEPRAQLRCATGAGCEGGRVEEVKAMLAQQPGEFEEVAALAAQMVTALRSRQVQMFVP